MLALPVSLIPDSLIVAPKRSKRSQQHVAEDTESCDVPADAPAAEASAAVPADAPAAESDDEAEVTVQVSAPTVEELKRTRTLRDLKDLCTELGLSNAGKKEELASRIVAARSSQ